MIESTNKNKRLTEAKTAEVKDALAALNARLGVIGNLVHDSVPIGKDEKNNKVVRTWGERRTEPNLKNHVDLVKLLGIADLDKGADVAGDRGYYLIGDGVLLNQALINFGLTFLKKKGYKALQPPFFMRKEVVSKCAQLAQFDEELYTVNGEGDDKYLISTAEQPLYSYHMDDWIHTSELPKRYSGSSSCFRKEAGAHGRDTLGIFRVHQFEKVEQFCLTSPNGNDSWDMHEEMLSNSEEFYQMLKIPYQVVAIGSGALNDSAAKKLDLEAWFPASATYRELVSCSNCTDYQSRKLEIRYGRKMKGPVKNKQYVHLLNSTLTATERTICCILENYQREDGVDIPEVLQPFMGGITFLPFEHYPGSEMPINNPVEPVIVSPSNCGVKAVMTQDELKKIAAYEAVKFVQSGMVLGLGTGSTAKHAVERIGELLKQGTLKNIVGIPTSIMTRDQAISVGIPLSDLDNHPIIDLAIDGTDEVDPHMNLVKGRGGSLLREKMVEATSKKFMVIVDESKLVKYIGGSGLAMPVEIVPFCWKFTLNRLEMLFMEAGCVGKLRMDVVAGGQDRPFVTDNGNYIIDLYFKKDMGDLSAASDAILRLPGVVEHGMFLDMATTLIVAGEHGVTVNNKLT